MAARILTSRLMQQTQKALSIRVSAASMASSSAPIPTSSKAPTTTKKRRESLKSVLSSIFGGYLDPADPNEPPIPVDKANFPDVTDHATGEEKLFLLAFENGILDPYCNLPVERKGRGTKDNPVKVESFFNERIVACICEESQNFVKYMQVRKGEPKRCSCGHWIECVDAPRFWEKIPKEDLIQITEFRELEEEGKLDKFLKTGRLDDDHHQISQKQHQ